MLKMLMMPFSFLLDGTRPRPVLKTTLLRTLLIVLAAGLGTLSNATEAPLYLQQALDRARVGGEGDYRWFGLKIYEARLWVGNQGYRPDMPEQLPFALELRYARSLAGDRIARASIDEMRKLGRGSERQHVAWLAAMQQLFPDVKEGDRITGLYLPGQGARFFLKDASIGAIDDTEFGSAFFAIWLAPNTSAPSLRTALLSHAGPRH